MRNTEISYEYIRGVAEREGCFTFSTNTRFLKDGTTIKRSVPAFSIGMHERDCPLLEKIRDRLKLKNKVYIYDQTRKDGFNRGRKAFLIVREFISLKNIIVPLFYKKLHGNKKRQFESWIDRIGSDPSVSERFKFIYSLHQYGHYDKNSKFES